MKHGVALAVLLLGCTSSSPPPPLDAGTDTGVTPPRDTGPTDAPSPPDVPLDAGPPVAGDDCTRAIDIADVAIPRPDGTLFLSTSNAGAHVDMEVCDALRGPGIPTSDLVYRFVAPTAGRLHWELDPGTPPALFTVDVRTRCDDPGSNILCDECPIRCIAEHHLEAGDELFFVVTTILTAGGPEPGTFDLSVRHQPYLNAGDTCTPMPAPGDRTCAPMLECQDEGGPTPVCGTSICGDGFVGFRSFDCDDGNTIDGDGCSSTCEPDDQGAGGATCAEATTLGVPPVRLGADIIHFLSAGGEIVPGSDATATCIATTGPEAFYAFDIPVAGRLELGAEAVESLTVLSGCTGTELGCAAATSPGMVGLTIDRIDPGSYILILDRTDPSAATTAAYSVQAVLTPL